MTTDTDGLINLLSAAAARLAITGHRVPYRLQASGNGLIGHDLGVHVETAGGQLGQQSDCYDKEYDDADQDFDDLPRGHSVFIAHSRLA
ncbi:hypothetical protein THUN1379_27500 [Paludibacterium sp. THUN1379]|nr:hypothetical protein THUN1379_27500 [Paludibacterium sp. THUN1379]